MHEHVQQPVGVSVAVDDVVIEHPVAEEQPDDDQKRHGGKIEIIGRDLVGKITRDRDDHLAEGKDHIEHGTLREMGEVDKALIAAAPPEEQHHPHAEKNRRK